MMKPRPEPISGTDVLARRSGSRRRASESSGLDRRLRGEGSGTGTSVRVPVHMNSLLCLLSKELHRQPRAVYKYWAPCRLHFPLWPLVSGGHLFAVLVRQWIHDVSLPRLLWVELFVFSAMLGSSVVATCLLELFGLSALLGSTVVLEEDFVAMIVFSAMRGSSVALKDDFLVLVVFSAMLVRQWLWEFNGSALVVTVSLLLVLPFFPWTALCQ